jgi:hypothetical protein
MTTGLHADVRRLLIEPMLAFERWFHTSLFSRDPTLPAARMAARGVLGVGLNALASIGVPRPASVVPAPVKVHDAKSTYTCGSFAPFRWSINLPSDLADMVATPLGLDGIATSIDMKPRDAVRYVLAEYANTVSHECRHCEQVFRITQWVYLREFEGGRDVFQDLLTIYDEKFMPQPTAIRKPAPPPSPQKAITPALLSLRKALATLGKGSEEATEAAKWYHSMYGDMSKLFQSRRGGSDVAAYRDIPEEADAYEIGELVRDCLLEEWRLDLWKAPKFQMQHTNLIDTGA